MRSLLVFLLLSNLAVFGQKKYQLNLSFSGFENEKNQIKYSETLPDSLSVYHEINSVISQLQSKGFLLAEISEFSFFSETAVVKVLVGQKYKLVKLDPGNISIDALQTIGFREQDFKSKSLDPRQLSNLFERLLIYYEDRGYPFISVSIDNIVIDSGNVSGKLRVISNDQMVYDSLLIVGSAKINPRFLQTYLRIKPNMPYNEKRFTSVNKKLAELPYLTPVKSPMVAFSGGKADVTVFVNQKNANQFDGILGVQQNGENNKTQLVGNLKLKLYNALKRGELIDFDYRGLTNQSQILNLALNVPNVLSTDFGLAPSLAIYKQDTSFLNVDAKLGVNYLLNGFNTLSFFIENLSTSLIATTAYANAQMPPNVLDANTTFYGLGIHMENLDYRYNPRRGYRIHVEGKVGSRQIKPNVAIDPSLYQSIALSSTAYRLFAEFSYYKTITRNVVFVLHNETGLISGKNRIENELFRLGGQRSLRGFNEFSILASSYTYGNVDLRYIFGQNSYLFAFYNQGYTRFKTDAINKTDYPLGFGTGINFETNVGIISLAYALGKQQDNPLNLQQGKIHFGLIALF